MKRSNNTWVDGNGVRWRIRDMSDRHLINALHTQEVWHVANRYGGFKPIYFKMLNAAQQRGLRG